CQVGFVGILTGSQLIRVIQRTGIASYQTTVQPYVNSGQTDSPVLFRDTGASSTLIKGVGLTSVLFVPTTTIVASPSIQQWATSGKIAVATLDVCAFPVLGPFSHGTVLEKTFAGLP